MARRGTWAALAVSATLVAASAGLLAARMLLHPPQAGAAALSCFACHAGL
jgi:hypothetical protein